MTGRGLDFINKMQVRVQRFTDTTLVPLELQHGAILLPASVGILLQGTQLQLDVVVLLLLVLISDI